MAFDCAAGPRLLVIARRGRGYLLWRGRAAVNGYCAALPRLFVIGCCAAKPRLIVICYSLFGELVALAVTGYCASFGGSAREVRSLKAEV